MPPDDPKLSNAHRRLAHNSNLDSQVSYLNQNLKGGWPLAPAQATSSSAVVRAGNAGTAARRGSSASIVCINGLVNFID
jgi:hypothetical protein